MLPFFVGQTSVTDNTGRFVEATTIKRDFSVNTDVVILAAGQGTRMRSELPKVLHQLAGKTLLQRVADNAARLEGAQINIIVGHGADQVKDSFGSPVIASDAVSWISQEQQLGTGHAVQQALPGLRDDSICLILYADVPLTHIDTLKALIALAEDAAVGLLTVDLADATGYGRIVRDAANNVVAIVEHKDANDEQRAIKEINTGIMAVKSSRLLEWLPNLSNDNAQGEFYLTDIIAMASQQGLKIATAHPNAQEEVQGVNDRIQLAELERWYQYQQALTLMRDGVTLRDPRRFDLRGELSIGTDVIIDVNVVLSGNVTIGNNVTIHSNCVITDCDIADNVEILPNSVLQEASVANDCVIGPFARLRPGTQLAAAAKIGNFVETKKSVIGPGSKVSHLAYIGDAQIGQNVNIGAGTITCNYDGANKHKTSIGDGVFIGSNTSLVAPVSIGENATVGAGSTVTKDVAAHQLAVARGKQRNMNGWLRPSKKIK